MPYCSVLECKNDSKKKNIKNGGISYHRFPKDPHFKEQWIAATGRVNWMPTKMGTICSEHFLEDLDYSISDRGYRSMKPTAIPTLKILKFFDRDGGSSCSSSAIETETTQNEVPLILPEASDIIASVYHYLRNEFITMKCAIGNSCDLSPLADIFKRTSEATGVCEATVMKILKRRKRSQELKPDAVQTKRSKVSNYIDDGDVSPIEDNTDSEVPDEVQRAGDDHRVDDSGQTEQVDPLIETLKVELEEEHEDHSEAVKELIRRDPLLPSSHDFPTTAVQYFSSFSVSPTHAEVKLEPPDEELPATYQAGSTLHPNLTSSTQREQPPDCDSPQ